MANNGSSNTPPIWHSPAWITAIVGLVSAFLTLPDIVGNYLSKQQDIRLAEQKTEAARLGNLESKQEQEFKIVNNTLAQQGTERIFVLRYLAETLDDKDGKRWAQKEVERLDDLASRQEVLNNLRLELEKKQREITAQSSNSSETSKKLNAELEALKLQLTLKKSEVAELKKKAGLSKDRLPEAYIYIHVSGNRSSLETAAEVVVGEEGNWNSVCEFQGDYCAVLKPYDAPEIIAVTDAEEFESINVSVSRFNVINEQSFYPHKVYSYVCSPQGLGYLCIREQHIESNQES
ncbi:hypothetical protein ACQUQP_07495 [Marinobacterium sp. YM272]|uniref:hypothetical protein n=1 Tax=Marinobacterium sp. YM272 TaxID=3421654 RepID=UPI003D7FA83B